jgi:hypothetical protein
MTMDWKREVLPKRLPECLSLREAHAGKCFAQVLVQAAGTPVGQQRHPSPPLLRMLSSTVAGFADQDATRKGLAALATLSLAPLAIQILVAPVLRAGFEDGIAAFVSTRTDRALTSISTAVYAVLTGFATRASTALFGGVAANTPPLFGRRRTATSRVLGRGPLLRSHQQTSGLKRCTPGRTQTPSIPLGPQHATACPIKYVVPPNIVIGADR